jgi:transposase
MQLGETITTRDVVASWNIALRGLEKLKLMKGSRVKWSPNSPRSGAVKTERSPGTPRQRNI